MPALPSNYVLGSLVINSGATLTRGAFTLTCASLTGSGTTTGSGLLTIGDAANASAQFDGIITGSAALTKAGTGTLTLTGTNTYTGATTISAGTISIGSATATLGPIANSAITISGSLDLNGNSLEVGSIAGAGTITSGLSGSVTLTVGANATATTFSGVINDGSGQVSLVKKGAAILTLSGTNLYSGTTTVNAGTIKLGNNNALGTTAATTISSGAAVDLNGFSTAELFVVSGTLSNGTGTAIASGDISLVTSAIIGGASNANVTGIISGSGTLLKSGAGLWNLSGANTFTGATTVSAGTLQFGNIDALGSTASTAVSSGAILDLNGYSTTKPFTLSGSLVNNSVTAVTVAGDLTLSTSGIIGGSGDAIASGVIGNTGTLTKSGSGTWTISGTNTYTGATTVSAGTLKLGNDAALGTTTATTIATGATVDLNGFSTSELFTISGSLLNNSGTPGSASGNITLTTAAIIGGTGDATASGIISGTGTLTKSGAGAWTISGINTYTSTTSIVAGTIKMGSATSTLGPVANSAITITGTLDLNGNSLEVGSIAGTGTITSGLSGSVTLTVGANNSSTTFSGVINDGNGQVSLIKKGTGTHTLSGANLYTGTTTVNAGTLTLGNNAALGNVSGGTTIALGATIDLNGFSSAEPFTISGSLVNNSANAATSTGSITLATAAIIGGSGAGGATASGIVSGTGTLQKTGTGTWNLSGVNTYTGSTTVSAGTLQLGNNDALGGTTSATTIASGAIVDLNGFATAEPFVISGSLVNNAGTSATASGNITLTTAAILSGSGNAAATGIISGTGTLTKSGIGTWILSGTNSYTSTTTVSTGTLQLGNNAALGTTTATTIATGATAVSYTHLTLPTNREV